MPGNEPWFACPEKLFFCGGGVPTVMGTQLKNGGGVKFMALKSFSFPY